MSSELTVIVPSRGRAGNIGRLSAAFIETCTADTELLVCIDTDDPAYSAYWEAEGCHRIVYGPRLRLGGTLNLNAPIAARTARAVGFMGDDHLPRTIGWDKQILEALDQLGTGMAYGNDLNRGADLPTAVFMTSDIITKLGYMVPPGMVHLYLDDFWLALGRALGAITYLPDVVIEHLHPTTGKADTDAGYAEVNASALYESDGRMFNDYVASRLAADVERIRG